MLAIAGTATTASAQGLGDILFTTNDTNGGSDTIQLLDYSNLTPSTLVTFAPGPISTNRLLGGIAQGPTGEFYFANSPLPPQNPSTASIIQVDNMFNPGLRTVSTLVASDPVQNVEGMAYDSVTNNLLFANNPGSFQGLPLREEGILGVDLSNPTNISVVVAEPSFNDPRPRDNAYNVVRSDRLRTGNFYIGAANGGIDDDPTLQPGQDREASVISRLVMNNPADPTVVSYTPLIDLSASITGLDRTLSLIRGIASADNGNLYIVEERTRSLYEIQLDSNGDYVSISKILDLDVELDSANTGIRHQPYSIIFNEFTGKLNYIERNIDSGNFDGRIVEVNLDGTGRTVLLDNVDASSLFAVPAPSALALLGLGGLAASRRRR
ncbi:MAG: hypothetical protein COB69_07290 [Phycisphaera sp.]|nr:MAG: hypothetical protein COB69_07290 [Phycisphaera sp.]